MKLIEPKDIRDYFFPVKETRITYQNPNSDERLIAKRYKGIINEDTGELISIVGENYKLISNKDLIESLLETLEKTDIKCFIYNHPRHNYITNNAMKLTLNFPELKIRDDTPDGLHTSLSIYNSYDMSMRVRAQFGTYRVVCSNGAIMFIPEIKMSMKHIVSFDIEVIKKNFDRVYNKIPEIERRISILRTIDEGTVIGETIKTIKDFSPSMSEYAVKNNPETLWALYNLMTYYITHQVAVRQHQTYQTRISKIFHI